jgi:hypothetical protein
MQCNMSIPTTQMDPPQWVESTGRKKRNGRVDNFFEQRMEYSNSIILISMFVLFFLFRSIGVPSFVGGGRSPSCSQRASSQALTDVSQNSTHRHRPTAQSREHVRQRFSLKEEARRRKRGDEIMKKKRKEELVISATEWTLLYTFTSYL